MQKFVRNVILVIAAATSCSSAFAGTATATMTNTVTISNNCSISTTGFTTTYDPVVVNASVNQYTTATVSTTCTVGASPVITLGQGANPGAGSTNSAPVRRLSNGATPTPAYLNYGLFSDTNHTVTWGNTAATAPTAVTATGAATPITIYASIPAGQTSLPAATYTDTVVATVTF
ncbi:spore Coat Protein U domain protein [Collimonas arenae]|uniref:Spore Coat Protein U domain protein n=1 Tax=Collimonas arenae TaxID=279058 RepID=A0A127QIA3_9BURK|nr:spore coat protein U domain-containing protein [Collimonas arenae]AMO99845.1 spore Coat Protein U domain protein [Collimonas arenae]AMP09744.1 spore Coat Protein U domain protein [Collimonas arenae]